MELVLITTMPLIKKNDTYSYVVSRPRFQILLHILARWLNGGIYDLQVSVNQTLFSFAGKWVAEPFIANVVVNDL